MVSRYFRRAGLVTLLLWLALSLRLVHFNQLLEITGGFLEHQPFCGLDANSYHSIYALGILDGSWPTNEPYFHMILYPYFLAAVYWLVGVNLRVVVFVQILLEVLACAALYAIGRRMFSHTAGLLAAALLALYKPLIFFNPCFAQVTLSLPLLTLALFLLLRIEQRANGALFALLGLVTGLAALSRPTFFLLPPLMLGWLWWRRPQHWRPLLANSLLYLAVIFVTTAPAAWHNYRTAGRFWPMPLSGPEIFFLGNNPVAEGMGTVDFSLFIHLDNPDEAYIQAVIDADKAGQPGVYRAEAIKFITTRPADWLNLLGRKVYLLLLEKDDYFISPYFLHDLQTAPILRYLPVAWRSLFLAALLGLLLVPHRHRLLLAGLLAVFVAFTLLFHVQFRFRLLFTPLAALYAAALVSALPSLRPGYRLGVIGLLALLTPLEPEFGWLLALCAAFILWPWVEQRRWQRLGWALLALYSYAVVALLANYVLGFVYQAGQRQSIFKGPEIHGPVAVGQTFVMHCNGFNRAELTLGAFGPEHPQPAIFHLRSGLDSHDDIYSEVFAVAGAADRSRYTFTFPAQPDSAGQSYFLFVESPLAQPNAAITLRGAYDQPVDRYVEGSAYAGQPGAWARQRGDLSFRAFCEGGWLALAHQALTRLAATSFGSAAFYWGVWLIHLALLAAAGAGLARFRWGGRD